MAPCCAEADTPRLHCALTTRLEALTASHASALSTIIDLDPTQGG
jgi:hypothetical protein